MVDLLGWSLGVIARAGLKGFAKTVFRCRQEGPSGHPSAKPVTVMKRTDRKLLFGGTLIRTPELVLKAEQVVLMVKLMVVFIGSPKVDYGCPPWERVISIE